MSSMPSVTAPPIQVGSRAPRFEMPATPGPGRPSPSVSLDDYAGRWLVLMFYPRDFSLVCPTELLALSARSAEFLSRGCDLLGVSCDTIESHLRWIETPRSLGGLGGLGFPLASDLDGRVSASYGVFLPWQHIALRGLFIIDPNGVLQYQVIHNLSIGRRADEILRVLTALQTGGLCAEDWTPATNVMDPTVTLGPGSVVSSYRIEAVVGTGSFATVYKAIDQKLMRPVALKVLRPHARLKPADALHEARAAAALNHPNVCIIYGVDESDGVPIIAMEYLSGTTLGEMIRQGHGLSPEATCDLGAQIADALAAAHAAGVVHGDLKPGNVFVTAQGRAKVLDFGLARRAPRVADPDATVDLERDQALAISGTPSYMAPEQTLGAPATPASDVFALGLLLREMLTGKRVFDGDNVLRVLDDVRHVDPARVADGLIEPFSDLVRAACVADPARRALTMTQIARELRAALPELRYD